MQYTKLFFLSASMLISNSMFAADVSKTRQYAQFIGGNVPASMVRFAKKGTTADLAREILSQVKVPTGAEITLINLGEGGDYTRSQGPRNISEDVTYNVDYPGYQPRYIVVYLKMPSVEEVLESTGMGIVQINDELLKKKMRLIVPKRGKVIDIKNAYKKVVTVPEDRELLLVKEGEGFFMKDSDFYTTDTTEGLNIPKWNLSMGLVRPTQWDLSTGWIEPKYGIKE
jgi:hypothetical protein